MGRLFYYFVVISLQPLSFAEIVRSSNQYLLQCSKVEVAHWSLWSSKKGYWWGKVFVWNRGLVVDLGKLTLHAISQNFQYWGLIHPQCICCGQNFSWFKFYFLLFQTHNFHTSSYPKTKENIIWAKDKVEPQDIHL